ncbi:MAG: HD domain-containing phosphohydrolase [Bryobacteraceae bacterium]
MLKNKTLEKIILKISCGRPGQKLNDGAELSPAESALYKSHPATGCRLLENIPRLETVVRIIEKQEEVINPLLPGQPLGEADRVLLGTHL